MSDIVLTDIVGVGADGSGIARPGGKVTFVPGALLGETVRCEVVRSGAKSDRARLLEVVKPVGRVESPCAHDQPGGCGGCSLLHASREGGAAIKRRLVQDALQRVAGVDPELVEPARTPGPALGYRNHARFGVEKRSGRLTYVARGEGFGVHRDHIAVESCVVLHPKLDALREELCGHVGDAEEVEIRVGVRTGERIAVLHGVKRAPPLLDVRAFEGSLALRWRERVLPQKAFPWIHEEIEGRRYRVSATAFFQVNTDGAEELVRLVREAAEAKPGARVLDLYAGVGLFSIGAMSADVDVLAAEIDELSISDFRCNAADRPRAALRALTVEEFLRDFKRGRDAFDVGVVNPPRNGMGDAVARTFAALEIPRVVMVSCDPGTLARDLRVLFAAGYAVKRVTPVDQFPGTPHVETVVRLDHVGAAR